MNIAYISILASAQSGASTAINPIFWLVPVASIIALVFAYNFYKGMKPQDAIGVLLRGAQAGIGDKYAYPGMSTHELVILASIIEKEGIGDETERKNIASVLYNRLETTDRETYGYLQLDTTIYYALSLEGKDKTAFDKDLDSPYNTYKYPGLPAGPICCPGMESIKAAIYPNDTEYFYFAAGKDGVNHFFKTYNEHLAFINSDMYQPD